MTDKEKIIIDGVDVSGCLYFCDGYCNDHNDGFKCNLNSEHCYYKQLKRKEQEYEELRQYHNKCCKEFENEKQALLEKYNQVSINFYNGDYCNTEHCSLLKAKEQECEELKRKVELMMDCPDCKVDEYKKALEEIEKVCLEDTRTFADGTQIRYDSLDEILNIINKAKGEECN